jgi:anti-sigma28 factor (negative regulator of flagellin synthesis)
MFPCDLPIKIMRNFSLSKVRKSWALFEGGRRVSGFPESSSEPSYIRMERVASLRAAIAQGDYHVSAADLAQKLMDHMLAHRQSRD